VTPVEIDPGRPWWHEQRDGSWQLSVRVQPGASRTEVAGEYGDQLRIRLQAPPVDGKANAALVTFVAERLGVPRSAVSVVRGQTSRSKVLRVDGVRLA
jgi:uncharacterized protein (TIGR00251 family)